MRPGRPDLFTVLYPASPGAEALKLKLATYNIHRAIGVDRRFRPSRIVSVIQAHDPDVVLLQEVDDDVPRSDNLDLALVLATELGYAHYDVGYNHQLRRQGRYGNATLSRFPIEDSRNVDLTIGRRKKRGCQHTTLLLPGPDGDRPVEVFNLHLGLSARERHKQVALLAEAPELAKLDPDHPCIIGGDFNDWRSLLRPFFVDELGFLCATDHQTLRGPLGIKTYPSIAPRGALDKIYYRGGLELLRAYRCRHQEAKVASDHLPLLVDLELH